MRPHPLFALIFSSSIAGAQPVEPDPTPPPVADPTPAPPVADPTPAPVIVSPTPPPVAGDKDKPAVKLTYDRGLAFATTDKAFKLKVAFRNQIRFESLRATEDDSESLSKFSIPRSRLTIDGNVFGEGNRLKVEVAFGDNGGFGFVKDLWIDRRLCDTNAWLRAGVWRRPFNRQELVSDFGSEFNERAITAAFVGGGRDLGVGIHNDLEKSPDGLEWSVGVFNGLNGGGDKPNQSTTCKQDAATGAITCATTAPTNVPNDFGPAIVARLGWNSKNAKGYSEGDFEGGAPRYAVGASYKVDLANFAAHNLDGVPGKEPYSESVSYGAEIDGMFKAHGFGLELGFYAMRVSSRLDPKITTIKLEYGVLVQPGYFVIPKRLQVAGRFAYSPDRPGGRELMEVRGSLNYFWHGHDWKFATDVGALKFTEDDPKTMKADKADIQVRSMLQLVL